MRRLNELKISDKDRNLLNHCAEVIKKIDSSAQIIFYGSRARDKYSFDSDYDILILIDGEVNLNKEDIFRQQLFPIELEVECPITVNVYNTKQWHSSLYQAMPFYQNVNKDGVLL